MSGPKSSRYTLTPEQRRLLREQRERERRIAVAKEKIKRNIRSIQTLDGLLCDKRELADINLRVNGDSALSEAIKSFDEVTNEMRTVESVTDYSSVDSLEALERKTSESLSSVRELSRRIEEVTEESRARLHEHLNASLDRGFEYSFADLKPARDTELDTLRKEALERLSVLLKAEYIKADRQREVERAILKISEITDAGFLKSFVSVSVSPLESAVNEECAEHLRCRDEYDALYAEYIALCEMYYLIAVDYPCTDEGVSALREETERIRATMDKSAEQEYIAECLDEVMREMGYSVIGSREVTKKNGKHFRNELYSYGEGTAVNVTYSSDGRISMELGGIDDSDRLPSEHESAYLCTEMQVFCGDFSEIEQRLLKKGVVLSERISLLPPDSEYAQIINTADYEMKTEAGKLSVKKKQIKKAEQKAKKQE